MATKDDTFRIKINGESYSVDDLSFREMRELRATVREMMDDDEADIGEAAMMDLVPALVYVVAKRTDPEFELDQALDMNIGDLLPSEEVPPTKPARAKPKPKAKV